MLKGSQIRKKFLNFFELKGHTLAKSASLIPQNDPTLFFTNAGMVPFKNIFTGEEKRDYVRATSSQKCMRVSGKHNDLENVGRTARHHTFFEMLGNFSFGDYFKKEAIAFAWEFLTTEIGLDKNKLWVTVFRDDDEAARIWHEEQGVSKDRIVRMGEKDNFWSMGETGPCGPCSEIIYEQDGPCGMGKSLSDCRLGECDCDRLLEIWNLVFMQFERFADGKMVPLPKPSIDTGMGLERLSAIMQGKQSNYDSDLFSPIIDEIQKIVGYTYGHTSAEKDVSVRVIADHIRATVFLIADGVLPSNEGRGYVLRRIMRRAIRHGKLLGQESPFFFKLVSVMIREYGEAYPELVAQTETVTRVIHAEEERFYETLDKGLKILGEEMARCKKDGTLSGGTAFKLYDTFGFPLDLTELIAAENGLGVDLAGFEKSMQEQRERARAGWKGSGQEKLAEVYLEISQKMQTVFLGYDTLEATGKVLALIKDGKTVQEVTSGEFEFICDQTPFYGEGGGQVGDVGNAFSASARIDVTHTHKPVATLFVHQAKLTQGRLNVGDTLQLNVSRHVRKPTMRHHTATHIMHAALRKILGTHVRQAGSFVNDKILRFDFSHFEAIPRDVLHRIENEVNQVVLSATPVQKREMAHDQAIAAGALAFFGDKYGDKVRVVSVGDYSVELCGGTHLESAAEIGMFRIVSEGSVAAGVRRIEAVAGEAALALVQEEQNVLLESAEKLKVGIGEVPARIEKLQLQIKSQEKEIEKLKKQAMSGAATDYLKDIFVVKNISCVVYIAENLESPDNLRELSEIVQNKLGEGIAIVGGVIGGKPNIVVSVSKALQKNHSAGNLVKALAECIGGRGGGRPDRAQAGGTEVTGLEKIREKLEALLTS